MLKIDNLTICYGSNEIVRDVSLTAAQGTITCLIGKSGTGKTSVLRAIAQLIPYSGSITIDEKNSALFSADQRASTIGMVFQQFNLFEHCTVLKNCMQPLMVVKKLNVHDAKKSALHYLAQFSMHSFADQYPQKLSGGQQQRVAIARALCLQPKVLLLDEPTSALDPENIQNLIAILNSLKQQGYTLIVASHDMNFVDQVADTIIEL